MSEDKLYMDRPYKNQLHAINTLLIVYKHRFPIELKKKDNFNFISEAHTSCNRLKQKRWGTKATNKSNGVF